MLGDPVSRSEQRVREQKTPVAAQRLGAPQRPVQPLLLAAPRAAPEEADALHAAAQPIHGDQRRRNAQDVVFSQRTKRHSFRARAVLCTCVWGCTRPRIRVCAVVL